MTPQRVLLVGAGAIGRNHANAVSIEGDVVAAVVDPERTRAQALVPGATPYPTIGEAIAGGHTFDAAIVASPSALHVSHATELLTHGLPVLLEKPHRIPGQSVGELNDLVAAGGVLQIGMSTRHWPGMVELHRAVHSGELGTVISCSDRVGFQLEPGALASWYFDRRLSGGGVLVTNGVHALDRVRWLLGEDLILLSSWLSANPAEVTGEREAALLATTATGVQIHVSVSWSTFPPQGTGLLISGTKGTGFVGMSGAWSILSEAGERRGAAIDLETEPFVRQWRSFLQRVSGFGLDDLEPTITLIERIYEERSHG